MLRALVGQTLCPEPSAVSAPCASPRPFLALRLTTAHEESPSYIDGSEWERPTTTPASTCSDAALTRMVAFGSAFPNLQARARADLPLGTLAAASRSDLGISDGLPFGVARTIGGFGPRSVSPDRVAKILSAAWPPLEGFDQQGKGEDAS